MTKADLHQLVDALPDDALDRVAAFLRRVSLWQPDPEQAWFWRPEWLDGELEADAEAAAEGGAVYDTEEEFLAALHVVLRE